MLLFVMYAECGARPDLFCVGGVGSVQQYAHVLIHVFAVSLDLFQRGPG